MLEEHLSDKRGLFALPVAKTTSAARVPRRVPRAMRRYERWDDETRGTRGGRVRPAALVLRGGYWSRRDAAQEVLGGRSWKPCSRAVPSLRVQNGLCLARAVGAHLLLGSLLVRELGDRHETHWRWTHAPTQRHRRWNAASAHTGTSTGTGTRSSCSGQRGQFGNSERSPPGRPGRHHSGARWGRGTPIAGARRM